MYNIPSYWKSANIGDPKLVSFFSSPCDKGFVLEEKIDGSQFSAAVYDGKLYCRSRSKQIDISDPEKMFSKTVEALVSLHADGKLPDNTIIRGESVTSLKHNTLRYSRTPEHFLVVFGAECAISGEPYHRYDLECLCDRIGFEVARLISTTNNPSDALALAKQAMGSESMLGGALIEGVVIKRLSDPVYFLDRPVFAKLVSEEFREQHKVAWGDSNPDRQDILQRIVKSLSGPARYAKAVQHLADEGKITGTVQDIGAIIKEVKRDVIEEGEAEAKEALWNWAKDKISRAAGSGVPQWYKDRLLKDLESQIEKDGE